jgi:gluconolactonase
VVLGVAAVGHAAPPKSIGSIERTDPAFDKLVPKDATIEVLADGFEWSEGPVWVPKGEYVLFSDIPNNRINKWKAGAGISVFMEKSGYTGKEPFTGKEPGSNGLMLDSNGVLHMCCHGDRAIKRVEADGKIKVLADKYNGKRLNSPNDLIFANSGDLYFTDPPYGLPKQWDDEGRELDFCGVYRLAKDGKLTLLTDEMTRPNGIGFSPDQKTLYVAQSDPKAAIWKKFPVKEDGTLGKGEVFFDSTAWVGKQKGLPDGLAVDSSGNVWATGPGGVICFSPEGKVLGKLLTGEATANCKFGDDGSTLYITADMYFCRVKTKAKGLGF